MPGFRKKLQRIFWLYLTENFVIRGVNDFRIVAASSPCNFVPITADNSHRVEEFREHERITEYREKVGRGEIGFFAECEGKAVGSIWATQNRSRLPVVVRMYMPLMPQEALVHDIVTGSAFRGKGVGPFMVSRMAAALLTEYGASKIIIDVNVRNRSSLRMMEKVGLRPQERMVYLSLAGTLAFHKVIRHFQ